jgi:hypothetical protein
MGVKVRRGQRGSRRRAGSEFTQKMGVAAKARGVKVHWKDGGRGEGRGQGSLGGWGRDGGRDQSSRRRAGVAA